MGAESDSAPKHRGYDMAVYITDQTLFDLKWHSDPDHVSTTFVLNKEIRDWLTIHVGAGHWHSQYVRKSGQEIVIVIFNNLDHESLFKLTWM